jgi:phage terminase large subunit-like protein
MIQERRIVHGGEPDLREHIGNANAEIDPEERKIRIVKRSELLKIDLAVAMSMANNEIMRLNL